MEPGPGSQHVETQAWARHTGEPTRETTERDAEMMQVAIFGGTQRGPALYTRRIVMHRSKLDIRGAETGAEGMSISSGSGGASDMGASSSSSDASAMAHSTGSSGGGSGSMCLEKSSSWAWSVAASSTASLNWASLWTRTPTGAQRLIVGRRGPW